MLDLLLSFAIGSRIGNTYLAHKEALCRHPLVARVFFPDIKEEPPPPPDDTFPGRSYDVTC